MSFINKPAVIALVCLIVAPANAVELPATMQPPPAKPATLEPEAEKTSVIRTLPESERLCREQLKKLGVGFTVADALRDGGCRADHPVEVGLLPGGVELRPAATLSCSMALATAKFVDNALIRAVRDELGQELAAINQASAYVCRPRNGTQKLSEHAFANALDVSALIFKDQTRFDIRAYGKKEAKEASLLQRIRTAACGPFKTVLGPGSDADHSDHLHLDLAQRRNGSTFCR